MRNGMRSRRGVSLTEVLVSFTVLAISVVPIVGVGGQNIQKLRQDSVRMSVETLCHGVLELQSSGVLPNLGVDPATPRLTSVRILDPVRYLHTYGEVALRQVLRNAGVEITLTVEKVSSRLSRLECRAEWIVADSGAKRSVQYERYIGN